MAASLMHQSNAVSEECESRPLGEVLVALAQEIEQARALSLRIEGAMCAVAVGGGADPAVVGELQQFDAVIQRLAALRDFASALSLSAPIDQRIFIGDALKDIGLASVRAHLGGASGDSDDGVWEML